MGGLFLAVCGAHTGFGCKKGAVSAKGPGPLDSWSMAELTENARHVLSRRYLLRDEALSPLETPEGLFRRVARAVASAEREEARGDWAARFEARMEALEFLPNSPTLMNAGRPGGQLAACFVLPVEDDLAAIFDALKWAALIHQSGGGNRLLVLAAAAEGRRGEDHPRGGQRAGLVHAGL